MDLLKYFDFPGPIKEDGKGRNVSDSVTRVTTRSGGKSPIKLPTLKGKEQDGPFWIENDDDNDDICIKNEQANISDLSDVNLEQEENFLEEINPVLSSPEKETRNNFKRKRKLPAKLA
jgi:hypothetical protein